MEVTLDRPGVVYYVAAPAGDLATVDEKEVFTAPTIPTAIKIGSGDTARLIEINARNDGRYDNENYKSNNTYIPEKGSDRLDGDLKDFIHFVSGGDSDEAKKYSEPTFDQIFAGSNTYGYDPVNIKWGSVTYTSSLVKPEITGLHPDTWYYIYIVLQSDGGTLGEVVQIYRVKTTVAQPPTITVSHSGSTGVSMTVNDPEVNNTLYDNPMLYYALARKDDLPEWFSDYYAWNADHKVSADDTTKWPMRAEDYDKLDATSPIKTSNDVKTVLDAIISKTTTNGKSYFDQFASNELKYQVMQYITISTSDDAYGNSTAYYPPVNANQKTQECEGDLKEGGEYVMLVCARHYDSDANDGTQYGFAATQGLFKPDNVPPEFTGNTGKVRASFTGVFPTAEEDAPDYSKSPNWPSWPGMERYYFDGIITLEFSKPIYTYRNGSLKQIVGGNQEDKSTVGILRLVNSAEKFTRATMSADGTSFTLTYSRMQDGQGLSLTGLYNASGTPAAIDPNRTPPIFKTLRITLNTYLTTQDYYPDQKIEAPVKIPGFEISWG